MIASVHKLFGLWLSTIHQRPNNSEIIWATIGHCMTLNNEKNLIPYSKLKKHLTGQNVKYFKQEKKPPYLCTMQ